MNREVISTCPVCSGALSVTRLHCGTCGTSIEGDFNVGRFGRLTREQMTLLESFLRSRGNLREMERELGLSYPTVRSRVDAVIRALGLGGETPVEVDGSPDGDGSIDDDPAVVEEPLELQRQRILERVASHEISAQEAATAIRALGRSRR